MSRTPTRRSKGQPKKDLAAEAFAEGMRLVRANRALAAIGFSTCRQEDCPDSPRDGLVRVDSNGVLHVHPTRRAEPVEWAWAVAHAVIHLGFGHVPAAPKTREQPDRHALAARCAVVNRFLLGFPIGLTPEDLPPTYPDGDKERLAARWRREGTPVPYERCGTAGGEPDQLLVPWDTWKGGQAPDWQLEFAHALTRTVAAAMDMAGGRRGSMRGGPTRLQPWERALSWFISSYPLLGGIAAGITLVTDAELARAHDISVAAVNADAGGDLHRTRCINWRTRNGGSSSPTRCCTPPCGTATAAAPATRTSSTSPPTTSSTAGCARCRSARCPKDSCTTPS